MRRYLAPWASSSVMPGRSKYGAGVRPRGVEEQRVEIVAEVVVVPDVAARAGQVGARGQPRAAAAQRPERPAGHPPARVLGRDGQDLEQAHQVVGVPVALGVRLADARGGRARPGGGRGPGSGRSRSRTVPWRGPPPRRTVPSGRRTAISPRAGWPSPQRARRRAAGVRGLRRAGGAGRSPRRPAGAASSAAATEPSPGSKAGFRWNGTLFIASFTACQWMSPMTCWDMSGYRASARSSDASVSGRRRPVSSAQNGRSPPSTMATPACTRSPGSVNEKRYVCRMPKNGETCMSLSCW